MEQIIVKGSKKHFVSMSQNCHATFLKLRSLANSGNYWALTAVKEIESLLACNLFKPNLFTYVEAGNNGYSIYKLVLPGCMAYAHKMGTGFFIYSLEASLDYANLQKGTKKPGLHRIEHIKKQWHAHFVNNGQIKPMNGRLVTISDQHENISQAIKRSLSAISSSPNGAKSKELKLNGFDIHFTLGRKGIGGLYNRKQSSSPESSQALHESALLLAKTMESSILFSDVRWITEGGGSGVMTQAIQILKDKGISFKGKEHEIFFSNITTNLVKAEQLARDIGLTTSRLTHSRNPLNPHQLIGAGVFAGHQAAWRRYKQEKNHTILKYSTDIVRETSKLSGVPATFGITALGAATAIGVPASVMALPAGIVFGVALGLKSMSVATKLTEAWLPDLYESIEEKF